MGDATAKQQQGGEPKTQEEDRTPASWRVDRHRLVQKLYKTHPVHDIVNRYRSADFNFNKAKNAMKQLEIPFKLARSTTECSNEDLVMCDHVLETILAGRTTVLDNIADELEATGLLVQPHGDTGKGTGTGLPMDSQTESPQKRTAEDDASPTSSKKQKTGHQHGMNVRLIAFQTSTLQQGQMDMAKAIRELSEIHAELVLQEKDLYLREQALKLETTALNVNREAYASDLEKFGAEKVELAAQKRNVDADRKDLEAKRMVLENREQAFDEEKSLLEEAQLDIELREEIVDFVEQAHYEEREELTRRYENAQAQLSKLKDDLNDQKDISKREGIHRMMLRAGKGNAVAEGKPDENLWYNVEGSPRCYQNHPYWLGRQLIRRLKDMQLLTDHNSDWFRADQDSEHRLTLNPGWLEHNVQKGELSYWNGVTDELSNTAWPRLTRFMMLPLPLSPADFEDTSDI